MRPRPRFEAPAYRGSGKLDDRVALITGGDSGIGRAAAVLFAREGADVAFTYFKGSGEDTGFPDDQADESNDAAETADAISAEGRAALPMALDVRDPDACRRVVEETVGRFGHLDILVNNAAFQRHTEGLENISFEQWKRTFETNIFGYFHMAKAAIAHLPKGGVILNTGSITGLEGSPALIDYSATKGAIHAFTKSLAGALVERGIRVNCVAPGPVWTPLNPAERSDEETAHFGEDPPMGRPAQPEEIAPAFVYLASNADSSYVTGEVLTLLGGMTRAG